MMQMAFVNAPGIPVPDGPCRCGYRCWNVVREWKGQVLVGIKLLCARCGEEWKQP